jgi:hypothetical protein
MVRSLSLLSFAKLPLVGPTSPSDKIPTHHEAAELVSMDQRSPSVRAFRYFTPDIRLAIIRIMLVA